MTDRLSVNEQNNAAGAIVRPRGGKQGDAIVSELHGRYYEATYNGNRYGINGTLVTTSAAGTGTFTGLLVGNPPGSGYNLAMGKCYVSQGAALTAATMIGIQYGISSAAIVASLTTIVNRKANGKASVAIATAGATVTAMTSFVVFAGSGSGAITVPLQLPGMGYDFEGGLIIPPGYQIASYTSLASTTALIFTFEWEEVPIG